MDLDDLDDLFDEPKQTRPTVAQKKSSALNKYASKKDDLDDFDDSNSLDNILGNKKPSQTRPTYGGYSGLNSAQNSKPPKRFDDNEDTFFGGAIGGTSKKPQQTRLGGNDSFGGGGSRQGSAMGSRKSQAEQEADDFDDLLADITKPEPGANNVKDPLPTGTFRNSENDGWDDLNFGNKTGGQQSSARGFGFEPNATGGGMSSKKPQAASRNDDFDIVDNILDEFEEAKGIESTKKRPATAGIGFENKRESLWTASGNNASQSRKPAYKDDLDDLADDDDDDFENIIANKGSRHQSSNDNILERKKNLFGAPKTQSTGGLNTLGGSKQEVGSGIAVMRNQTQSHLRSQDTQNNNDDLSPGLGLTGIGGSGSLAGGAAHQNSNQNLNPNFAGFHGTVASGTGSQDSVIETIENPYSRANKRRMMKRPPTQSGAPPNDAHMQSVGSANQQRPMTGPAAAQRPPLKNQSSPLFNQDNTSDYINPLYNASQGSHYGEQPQGVQPSNFNFAPAPRTAGPAPGGGGNFGNTNMFSEADFERANSDLDEDDASYYVEEEVTDEEAMEKQKQEIKSQREADGEDPDDSDDSVGFYMPSIIQKTSSPGKSKPKAEKITKKVRTKKKKTTSNKKPPRQGSPPLGRSAIGKTPMSDNQMVRKSYTMSEETKNAMHMSNPASHQPFLLPGGSTLTSGNMPATPGGGAIRTGGTAAAQTRMLEMMDEKQILQYEIEQEKDKVAGKEKKQRDALETQRKMHQKAIEALQAKFGEQRKFIELEKQRIIEDKARTIELEKQKLLSLQKIDGESRDLTHQKTTDTVRELYADQQDSLRKQLEQKIQMNKLAEEVSKSSGDINSMVQKLSAEQESQLRQRENLILSKEQNLAERRRVFQEKRVQLDQRKRKIQSEQAELAQRQTETTNEYEGEKKEIFADIDSKETGASNQNREIRSRTIDLEVEVKRIMSDEDRVRDAAQREKRESVEKMEEFEIELKQIEVSRQEFRREMNQTEHELRKKLEYTENCSRDLVVKERAFRQMHTEFEEEESQVMHLNNQLQEQIEQFNMQKEAFERRAQAVKEQGENDQLDSEKIGFFKANKERIQDEMKKLRTGLEDEKQQLAEDRVKLEIFKNELRSKQKAIETMRYEYIKATSQENMMHFADQAKDLAMFNLTKETQQASEQAAKDLYPIGSGSQQQPAPPVETQSALLNMASRQSRFNYGDYMKGLNEKLSIAAPSTHKMAGGTGFQEFLLKERQKYLTSIASYEGENSMLGGPTTV